MSNPLKKIGKVFKKVGKGLKKIAEPLAIAAAIYFTGAALGAWGTSAMAAPGATSTLTAGGATAGAGSGLGLGAAEAGSLSATLGGAEAATAGLSVAAPAAPTAGITTGLSAKGVTTGLAAPTTTAGTLKGAGKAILGFMEKHPGTTMIAGQALSSAFTPSAAEEAMKLDQYRKQSSTFYGTGYGGGGPGIETGRLAEVTSGFTPTGQAPAPQIAGTRSPLAQYTGRA